MCLVPQQLEDIHVVILHKEEGAGLGFSIAGGSDLENKAPTVSSIYTQNRKRNITNVIGNIHILASTSVKIIHPPLTGLPFKDVD